MHILRHTQNALYAALSNDTLATLLPLLTLVIGIVLGALLASNAAAGR
jgi:hypothetical protein